MKSGNKNSEKCQVWSNPFDGRYVACADIGDPGLAVLSESFFPFFIARGSFFQLTGPQASRVCTVQ
jgi:hypothetical protein